MGPFGDLFELEIPRTCYFELKKLVLKFPSLHSLEAFIQPKHPRDTEGSSEISLLVLVLYIGSILI